MAALLYRADQLGHSLTQMADEMSVSYGYIAQLQSGRKPPESVSGEFTAAAARYLGVPCATIQLLCCRVSPAGRAN